MREFDVYCGTIDFLANTGWQILCASPPGGTDNRYHKCIIPRRDLYGSEKGPRDELDITAFKQGALLLVECKVACSQSLTSLNALGESDVQKLQRLLAGYPPHQLGQIIKRGTGADFDEARCAAGMIAFSQRDVYTRLELSAIQITTGVPELELKAPLTREMFEPPVT